MAATLAEAKEVAACATAAGAEEMVAAIAHEGLGAKTTAEEVAAAVAGANGVAAAAAQERFGAAADADGGGSSS